MGSTETLTVVTFTGITAEENEDAHLSSASRSFTAQSNTEIVTVNVVDDPIVEAPEVFSLTLQDSNAVGDRRPDPYRLLVVITDNDAEYEWAVANYTVPEGVGTINLCMIRAGNTTTTKVVDLNVLASTTTYTAKAQYDFRPLTAFTFRGTTEQCVPITIVDDDEPEGDETFALVISESQPLQIGDTNTVTITIQDDDNRVQWGTQNYVFSESDDTPMVQVVKIGGADVIIRVTSKPGTANSSDFEPINMMVTIPAAESTYDFPIMIKDDEIVEGDETFTLSLSPISPSVSTTSSDVVAAVVIVDDDVESISEPRTGLSATEIAATIIVTVVCTAILATIAVTCLLFRRRMLRRAQPQKSSIVQTSSQLPVLYNPTDNFNDNFSFELRLVL
ncbi:sodium/calcium exchanger 1-like [Amphiura filiformis]|uniref:sodium/calcium exchanger 1-like n=1 Tax=Amphiura filiformis TaxID=82378 RepID=UPI003B219100